MSACLAGTIGVLAYSTYQWLRFGAWVSVTLSSITASPRIGWVGVQRAVDGLWLLPLWMLLLLVAFALIFVMDRPQG